MHDGAQRGTQNMSNKKVVVLPGDDAAPEAMAATMDALRALKLLIDYVEFPPGEKWGRGETDAAARTARRNRLRDRARKSGGLVPRSRRTARSARASKAHEQNSARSARYHRARYLRN